MRNPHKPLVRRLLLIVLSSLVLLGAARDAGRMRVAVHPTPPRKGKNDFYFGNRAPLVPSPLIPLPLGAVRPRGWLRGQLERMSSGMIGHLPELSRWCQWEHNAWVSPAGEGDLGWEEVPYWLKGYGDLGCLLDDPRIVEEHRRWVEGVLASQQEDGWFGWQRNREALDLWPNMVMLDVLRSFYDAQGDPRVLEFMTRYFRWQLSVPDEQFLPPFWQQQRAGDNLYNVHWLYNRTGEPWLLELGDKIQRNMADWTSGVANWHGVNIAQCFRAPAQYYQQSRRKPHLQAAERNWREVREKYGQVPGGLYGADENCRAGYTDPRQAAETCAMVEMMRSHEILLAIAGDTVYADRCEDVAFNSLPAAQTPELDGLHYLTAPNMVQLDRENKAPALENSGCMLAYSPGERYRCCQHNVSHGWPYFTRSLWMATQGNGLAAAMYAPSEVEARVGPAGTVVRIVEETGYPFRETIDFAVDPAAPVRFPLWFRIPGWCEGAAVFVNGARVRKRAAPGRFVMVEREWRPGDRVRLELPMGIRVREWEAQQGAVSVDRGPLTYSLRIGERWERFGRRDRWAEWEVFPTTPWNYALVLDGREPAASIEVAWDDRVVADQPFVPEAPVALRAKARRLPEWQMHDGLVGSLQASPARTDAPIEDVLLVPMGCARLRISVFPVAGEGPAAAVWGTPTPMPLQASHVHNNILALTDGALPKHSADHSVPRFTWWDRKGSVEWVGRRFDAPRTLEWCEVYWYDDTGTGGCRVPVSWRLLVEDGESWSEVKSASGYPTAPDTMNRVTFNPVETTALRLEVQLQEGYSGGILEWRIGP